MSRGDTGGYTSSAIMQQLSRTDVELRDRKESSEPSPPELRPVEQGPNSTLNSTVVCRAMTVMYVKYGKVW